MRLFDAYGRFVTRRPLIAIGLVVVGTVFAIIGLGLTDDKDPDAFLPDGSELVAAQEALEASFPDSAALEGVQLVFRGDVLTPEGLATTKETTELALTDPGLGPFVDASVPLGSPGHLLGILMGDPTVDLRSLSQQQVDEVLTRAESDPVAAEGFARLQSLVAFDADGNATGGVGVVTVNGAADPDGLDAAQLAFEDRIDDLDLDGLDARTFSSGKSSKESEDSASSSIVVLMLVALMVIGLLLVVFYRSGSDVILSMGGLILTILWALGYQGLLGPSGVSLIGAPSDLGTMVPVMMIGLCVDYGIQSVSRYREALVSGTSDPAEAMQTSVSSLILPLGLAGGTTIISFLTNLLGDIPGLADFGVVAAVGVGSGLFIFLTFIPAVRTLLDRRAIANGKELNVKQIGDAIPGAGDVIERLGVAAVRRPGVILAGVGVVTLVLGAFMLQLESSFNSSDFFPSGSESLDDLNFLQDEVGGNTEPVTIVIEGDLSSDRTVRNLIELEESLEDPVRRPAAVTGEITESLGVLAQGLSPAGQAEIQALVENNASPLFIEPEAIDAALAIIEAENPERFRQLIAFGAEGAPDRTLMKFNAITGDADATRALGAGIDQLWFGDAGEVTAVANEITGIEVTDALTDSQARSILYTILAAIIVLVVFFWLTEFRPMLGLLAVVPILLVLVWVLGTMRIIGYDYNVVTAIITALSIGIGVDYTIHVVHRFLEEQEEAEDLVSAMAATMRTTGSALVGSALTTALGFMVLLFSPLPPLGQFGVLTAITVFYALIAAIVVLPPMLVIWAAYHDWRTNAFHDPHGSQRIS